MTQRTTDAVASHLLDEELDAFVIYDASLRVSRWSAALATLTGISQIEASERALDELFPALRDAPERACLHRAAYGTAAAGDGWFFDAGRKPRADVVARSFYLPLRGGETQEGAAVAIVRDELESRRRRLALRGTDDRFQAMADSSPVLLWMSATDMRCTFFNQTWLDFTGRTLEEEMGYGWAEGIHPVDFQEAMDTYTSAFVRREPFSMVYRLRRHDGAYRWILDKGAPRTIDGAFAGYIGSCVDITERMQAEDELRRLNDDLEHFARAASHDLRSPLRAIHVLAEWAAEEARDLAQGVEGAGERLFEQLDKLRGRSARMAALLDGMMAYVRAGHSGGDAEPFDVRAVVAEIADELRQGRTSLTFTVDLAGTFPQIVGPRAPLRAVLANLMENAVKHRDRDAVHVTVTCTPQGPFHELVVADDGPGIPPRLHRKAFEIFSTLKARDEVEASGLGLALVRRSVGRAGGTVRLDSPLADGRGTAVSFTWPATWEAG